MQPSPSEPDVTPPVLAEGLQEGLTALGTLLVVALAGWLLQALVFRLILRFAQRPGTPLEPPVARALRRPLRFFLPLLCVQAALPAVALASDLRETLQHGIAIGLIVSFAWLLVGAADGIENVVRTRYRVDVKDNLRARRVHTQLRLLARLLDMVIVAVAVAAVLMTFPRVRQFGAGLLASAGIAGIVVGFAARPILSNLIAGLQIALAEPIRLDDVVIVQGEWGRVEEITGTYVIVKIWDDRRLVVPLTWFLENPFQNWTRTTSELLGTVFLHTDYRVPLEELRAELTRLCEASPHWDRRVCLLQVTESRPETLELRALVSAEDSGKLWDLRCAVREGLVTYLAREHPETLPRTRAEVSLAEGTAAGGRGSTAVPG